MKDKLLLIYKVRDHVNSSVDSGTFNRIEVQEDSDTHGLLIVAHDEAMPKEPLVLPINQLVSITPVRK